MPLGDQSSLIDFIIKTLTKTEYTKLYCFGKASQLQTIIMIILMITTFYQESRCMCLVLILKNRTNLFGCLVYPGCCVPRFATPLSPSLAALLPFEQEQRLCTRFASILRYLRHSFPSCTSRPLFHSGIITVQFPSASSMGEDCTLRDLGPGPPRPLLLPHDRSRALLPCSFVTPPPFFSLFFTPLRGIFLCLSNLLLYFF